MQIRYLVLAGIVGIAQPAVAQQQPVKDAPYLGKWKCETGIFVITTREMQTPHRRIAIDRTEKRRGNTYRLHLDGSKDDFKFLNINTFDWDSGNGDAPMRCRRM